MIRKYNIVVGYNFRKIDGVVLSYAIFGMPQTPLEIYEFKERLLDAKSKGQLYTNDVYKTYSKRLEFISVYDLKYINSLTESDLLRVTMNFDHDMNVVNPTTSYDSKDDKDKVINYLDSTNKS